MAKIAKCGYGSNGQGLGTTADGYTYVVNDNVRTGDRIQVVSTSRNGKKFATTAVPLHTFKENTVKGQVAKKEAEDKTGENPTQVYSGKELQVSAPKTKKDTIGAQKPQSPYVQETRGGNLAKYMQDYPNAKLTQNAQETFESYSKKYMKQGE